MNIPKFCKDCEFCDSSLPLYTEWKCKRPTYNIITGGVLGCGHTLCQLERGAGACGPDAVYFSPKFTQADWEAMDKARKAIMGINPTSP
jgi:hypothetical protein